MNRLRLDWSLETQPERLDFLRKYIDTSRIHFTDEELEMMGRYVLWGKDPQTGLNGRQGGLELPTRFHTWDQDENFESLEALLESPTFSEQIFRKPNDPILRIPKLKFSRTQARKTAPPDILARFEQLWAEIDRTEYLCARYDLAHGKRKVPVRETLLRRLNEAERASLDTKASSLSVYAYLKKRHELVELRREQYTLKDSYSPPIQLLPTWNTYDPPDLLWGEDIDVRPFNCIKLPRDLIERILRPGSFPEPSALSPSDLSLLSTALWCRPQTAQVFDFSSIPDLDKFCALYLDLEDFCTENPSSTLSLLFTYFNVYVSLAPLKPFQRRLLDLKLHRYSNQSIRDILEQEFGKKYTLNYISTLYHQSILPSIAAASMRHREVLENLFFPENFKTCIDCGRTLLRNGDNFMKKSKVRDGFSPRCKECEKILREKRKRKDAESIVKVKKLENTAAVASTH